MTDQQQRPRRRRLLAEIHTLGGHITTGQAHRFYRATGWAPGRTTAKKDLQFLKRRGVLVERGPDNDRTYTLNSKGGTA